MKIHLTDNNCSFKKQYHCLRLEKLGIGLNNNNSQIIIFTCSCISGFLQTQSKE